MKSWPFEEARKILSRINNTIPKKGYVLFETGYGPSGLPHIGTFGEVVRTLMVMNAFSKISDIHMRLFTFSDDMDGLRKVPGNVPNKEMLQQNIDKQLTKVPDPFGKFESFGHHNNAMLKDFLDRFGFKYEFRSSTECYESGEFDDILKAVLRNYNKIMDILLPTLREERRKTYSPFLPICKRTGKVLQVPMIEIKPESDSIVYRDPETDDLIETLVTGGQCKLQWKVDWGARWSAFDVDYEMCGKDLIDSVKISSKVCKVLDGNPPVNLVYELFLDEKGEKISKSKGNGITIEEWLKYSPQESLAYYMYQNPKRAKRLYFDVIPRAMDEYLAHLSSYKEGDFDNPVYHIHLGNPPVYDHTISFTLLLNLASACHAKTSDVLWGFVKRYSKNVDPKTHAMLDKMINSAISYYKDFVEPKKQYKTPSKKEKEELLELSNMLESMLSNISGNMLGNTSGNTLNISKEKNVDDIQHIVFEVGKKHYNDLKEWFKMLYAVLLGQDEGPRMGSFIALYGVQNTIDFIKEKIS